MRLILLRHAKSDWGDPALGDRARPLNARGRKAAALVGAWIAARAQPDRILVSPAQRTRETWRRLGLPGEAEIRDALYLAEAQTIAHEVPDAGTVLLVGHNPGIASAAEAFAAQPPAHADFARYPTAACTLLEFDGPAQWGVGQVLDFAVPRDLEGSRDQ